MDKTNLGELYSTLWAEYLDLWREQETRVVELAARERADLELDEYMYVIETDLDLKNRFDKTMKDIFKRMVWAAEKRFAPDGGRLTIDNTDLYARHISPIRDHGRFDEFDPAAVWAELEAEYGGDKGAEIGLAQCAHELVRFFSIKPGMATERVGGRLSLSVNVWVDGLDKKYNNKVSLSYHSAEDIIKGLLKLETFATWAGESVTAQVLRQLAERFNYHSGREVRSRERIACDGIDIITYQSRFEFRFSQALGDRLMVFLSTYASSALRDQAA
jgi:hypothetical protein